MNVLFLAPTGQLEHLPRNVSTGNALHNFEFCFILILADWIFLQVYNPKKGSVYL